MFNKSTNVWLINNGTLKLFFFHMVILLEWDLISYDFFSIEKGKLALVHERWI